MWTQALFFTSAVPPTIEEDPAGLQTKQVVLSHALTLECNAAGHPLPALTWLKDGVPVKASDNVHIDSDGKTLNILSILEADQGQYVCVATSVAGEKEIKYEVEVLGKFRGPLLASSFIVHTPLCTSFINREVYSTLFE